MEIEKWKKKKEKARLECDLNQLYLASKELAEIYFRQEKYAESLSEYKAMERVSDANNNRMDVGRANRMIGEVYCEMGQFDKAVKHQLKHLKISCEESDKVEEQRALATLGRTYFLKAETYTDLTLKRQSLNEAKKYFKTSLSVCEELSDISVGAKQKMEMRSRLFLNIGLVFDAHGQTDEAIDCMSKAIQICKKMDFWEDLFRTYSALGSVYQKKGDKNNALSTYELAGSIAERLHDKIQALCDILLLKSEVLIDQPNFRGAREALLKAYKLNHPNFEVKQEVEKKLRIVAAMCETEEKLTDSLDSDYIARKTLYEDLGDMASELTNFSLALSYYHLMLECIEKSGGNSKSFIDAYVSLAQTYKDKQMYNKAIDYFKKELELEVNAKDFLEASKTSMNIAELYQLLKKYDLMVKSYETAKQYAQESNNNKLFQTVLKNMFIALTESRQFVLADTVQKEMTDFDDEESTDESEPEKKIFGQHICLEDLSDNEKNEKEKTKITRTRTRSKTNIHKRNDKGETPLHIASMSGNSALALKLIEQGHSVDVKDNSGWTPLHEACNYGHEEIVKILLEHGAPANDRGGAHCDGVTPLLDAASNGNFNCIEILLDHGASSLMRNNNGDTALDCLIAWRERRLKDVGHDLNGTDLTQYNYFYQKLQQTLEKAGQKPNIKQNESVKIISTRRCFGGVKPQKSPEMKKLNEIRNQQESATNEYDSAMRALRFKTKPELVSPMAISKPNIPALLNENETVDDWLEDDLVTHTIKKRRTSDFIGEPLRRSTEYRTKIVRSPIQISDNSSINEDSSSNDSFKITLGPSPSTSGSHSNKVKSMNVIRKKSIDLTEAGVSREKIKKLDTGSTSVMSLQPSSNTVCLKVKVNEKLLLVPVVQSENLTIAWLAQEAATRYKSLEGVEPVLRILTQDGAALVNTDPISLIISMGDLIGEAISWKLPPLSSIYQENCTTLNIKKNKEVIAAFENCQSISKLDLKDLYLCSKQFIPICKALIHFESLQSLLLSGNHISDLHFKDIADCLIKLPNLRFLDFSKTMLTHKSVTILAQAVSEKKILQKLKVLNMSYNPLGNCLISLSLLINNLPALTNLILASVDLTEEAFQTLQDFSLDCLEVLDINYNSIGIDGVIDILGRLDPRLIIELHLNGTSSSTVKEVGFYLQRNPMPCLTTLDISNCNPTVFDVQELLEGLKLCPRINKLYLDGINNLPTNVINNLNNLSSVRELSLCGIQANQIINFENDMANLAITSCVSQPWPRQGPYGFYSSQRDSH